jgi:hypothetical protein
MSANDELSSIKLAQFTFFGLNQIFLKHLGEGAGSLEIGGVTVTKSLAKFPIQAPKAFDWSVTYQYTDAAGVHVFVEGRRFASNHE